MSEWRKVRVGEIAEKIAIGPFGSRMKSDTYTETGGPVIRGTNLTGGRSFSGDWVYVSEEDADQLINCNVTEGDLVFPHRGAIGEVGIVPGDKDRYMLSTSLMKLRCDAKQADSLYLFYFFKSHEGRHQLLRNASQVGTPGIGQPLSSLKSIELALPPLKNQRTIAHILGSLDDKIELNRRMNETLEAMARAIYKSWFVDFDPVRAKASGEPAESICRRLGLTPDVLALFPDGFQDSKLGEIPAGWTVTSLSDLTTKIGSGATPRGGRDVYLEEGIALIRSQNVYDSEFVWDGLARISDEAADQLSGVEVKGGDVLLNITGASILRTCVVDPAVLPARVNQHVAIVRAKPGIPPKYLHLQLLRKSTKDYLLGMNAGASREAVTKGHIESVPIVRPSVDVLSRFQAIVVSLGLQGEQSAQQSRVLASIRDTLLPSLLCGHIDISTARAKERSH